MAQWVTETLEQAIEVHWTLGAYHWPLHQLANRTASLLRNTWPSNAPSEERHEYLDGVIYAMAGSASTQAMAGKVRPWHHLHESVHQPVARNSAAHPVAPSVRI